MNYYLLVIKRCSTTAATALLPPTIKRITLAAIPKIASELSRTVKDVNVQTIVKLMVVMITFGHVTTFPAAIFSPVTKESVTIAKATMEAGIKMTLSPSRTAPRKMQARTAVTVRETA
jgi:hypothetical protein